MRRPNIEYQVLKPVYGVEKPESQVIFFEFESEILSIESKNPSSCLLIKIYFHAYFKLYDVYLHVTKALYGMDQNRVEF